MARTHFTLPHMTPPPGYSAIIRDGDTVYLQGQVGIGPDGQLAEGLDAQARQTYENIRQSLELAGAQPKDVVQLMTFLKPNPETTFLEDLGVVDAHKDAILPGATPVGSTVRVVELFVPECLFEAQVIAVIGG